MRRPLSSMTSHSLTLSQLQMASSELSPDISQAMGFSTFGSKPHLAKKRKRNDPPDTERTGSNSLPLGSQRKAAGGVAVAAAADTHLSENNEDANGKLMEAGEDDMNENEYGGNGDDDIRHQAGIEHVVTGTSETAQTLSSEKARMISLLQRKTLPVLPPVVAATSTKKMTPMTESGSGYNFAALRRGVRNENGDIAYYDHSFVEDPWKELRGKNILPSTTL